MNGLTINQLQLQGDMIWIAILLFQLALVYYIGRKDGLSRDGKGAWFLKACACLIGILLVINQLVT